MRIGILGNGFGAIFSAYRLRKAGHECFLFLDNKSLGGVLNSIPWEDYDIDLGAQSLEVRDKTSRDFYAEILGSLLLEKSEPKYGSISNGVITKGIEIANVSQESFARHSLQHKPLELKHSIKQEISLQQHVVNKFGVEALSYFQKQISRFTAAPMDELHQINMSQVGFLDRLFISSNEMMENYKSLSKFNDSRFGVTYDSKNSRFLGKNAYKRSQGYPSKGMKTFVYQVKKYFKKQKIQVFNDSLQAVSSKNNTITLSNKELKLDRILSFASFPRITELLTEEKVPEKNYKYRSGTLLLAFEVENIKEKFKWDYIHNFDLESRLFRASAINAQFSKNKTGLIISEIPLAINEVDFDKKNTIIDTWEKIKTTGNFSENVNLGRYTSFVAKDTAKFLTHEEYVHESKYNEKLAAQKVMQFPSWIRGRSATAEYIVNYLQEENL